MKKISILCAMISLMLFSLMACTGQATWDTSKDDDSIDVRVIPTEAPSMKITSAAQEAAKSQEADKGQEAGKGQETAKGQEADKSQEAALEPTAGTKESVSESTTTQISESKPEITTITITATGDCTLGTTQKQGYEDSFDDVYDSNGGAVYFFDHVRSIFEQDDMTLINLECSLTTSNDRQEKLWNLKGKPEYIDILTGSSIEAVSMGNNHRLDYGEAGFEETVQLLQNADIKYAFDHVVGIYETKGITIGYVSVNEHYDGTLVEEFLQDGIAELKEKQVDLIIACCHWGIESTSRLDDYQVELGYKCIDWGADLVIGNHPHVLQAINQYRGKYIVYSLGNFCFGGNKNPKDKDTLIFQQTFTFEDKELKTDSNIKVIPCSISSVANRNNFQPTPATGDEAERIMNKINSYSEEFGIQFDSEGYLK